MSRLPTNALLQILPFRSVIAHGLTDWVIWLTQVDLTLPMLLQGMHRIVLWTLYCAEFILSIFVSPRTKSWNSQGVRSSGDQVPRRRRGHKLQSQWLRRRHDAGEEQATHVLATFSGVSAAEYAWHDTACPVLFGAPDEEPVQGGVRARPATAEHGVLAGQLQVQRRHPAQVRPLGGAHGAVPRQEVRTLHSLNHQFS